MPSQGGGTEMETTPEQALVNKKRKLEAKEASTRKTYRPRWYVEMDYKFETELQKWKMEHKNTFTLKEVIAIFDELIETGRQAEWHERPERYRDDIATKADIQELRQMTLAANPTYAAKVKQESHLRDHLQTRQNGSRRDDPPKYTFSVKLFTSMNRNQNEKEGTEIIVKVLEPRKNNIRFKCWLSRHSGNMVIEFPTALERDKARNILKPSQHKVLEKRDKKINIWCKFAQHLEQEPDETIIETLAAMNANLKKEELLIKWIGAPTKKRLIISVPARSAVEILKEPYLFTEGYRHPIEILNPKPFRCGKCLQFHNCKAEDCKNAQACRYCANIHDSDSCPLKTVPESHRCASCACDRSVSNDNHEAMSRECPTWRKEADAQAQRIKTLLQDVINEQGSTVIRKG